MFIDAFEKIFGKKERVMTVFAHPDDAQLYCGGTINRLMKAGKRVQVVNVNWVNHRDHRHTGICNCGLG